MVVTAFIKGIIILIVGIMGVCGLVGSPLILGVLSNANRIVVLIGMLGVRMMIVIGGCCCCLWLICLC